MSDHKNQVWTIINATPDSFWQASRVGSVDEILSLARQAIQDGASVLDIGAMSTRPGYTDIGEQEEYRRLRNALSVVRAEFPTFPISIDTFRSQVVRKIYDEFGAVVVNDISGGVADENMYQTVGALGLDYVMMSQDGTMDDMLRFFDRHMAQAQKSGVGNIILDPGFGFGKSLAQNFEVLHQIDRLSLFGCQVLVGVSRKSMIWRTLGTSVEDALAGTLALEFEALGRGANILRAHDTRQTMQILKL
ncbi:MAG: dihydropteroate synthase, partial [Mucinivorans sp.]